MTTIPVQLDQLLTLALSVVFVTQALKAIAARIDVEVGGKGAVVVSAVVAVALTLVAYGAGWVPITLIDGDRLLDLLIQYEIGVAKRAVEYLVFDQTKLEQFESPDALGAEDHV